MATQIENAGSTRSALFTITGSTLLGIAAIWLVFQTLNGNSVLFISTERVAVIALGVIGFGMCKIAMGRSVEVNGRGHPLNIVGYVLGMLTIVVIASAVFNFTLPMLADQRVVLIVLAGIIAVKFILARIGNMFELLI